MRICTVHEIMASLPSQRDALLPPLLVADFSIQYRRENLVNVCTVKRFRSSFARLKSESISPRVVPLQCILYF
jgi:hypothetical protein